jgi:hypothetical protein
MNIKKFALVFLVPVFVLLTLDRITPASSDAQTVPPPPGNQVAGEPDFDKSAVSPKIEYRLFRLYELYRTKGLDAAREYAAARDIDLDGETVRVVAVASSTGIGQADPNGVATLGARIASLGGTVETTYQSLVQNRLPIGAIETIAHSPSVDYLRLPVKPHIQTVTSEGVEAVGAGPWQNLDAYRTSGSGANVVVLDAGFTGHAALLGTELPATVTTKSFRADGNLSAHVHGTACAEIIHDLAPNASLTLVNFNTDVEHHNAVNWINSQTPKPDIVSYSMGWFNIGDGKGTGPICEDVKTFAENGGLWSSSAGNYANNHWHGAYFDPDNDGYMDFDDDGYEWIYVQLPAYYSPTFWVNWDDWGTWNGSTYSPGSSQDYDVQLFYSLGGNWNYLESSTSWQSGGAGQWPVEAVGGWYANVTAWWGIRIQRFATTRNCKLEVFITGIPSSYHPTPSDATGSLSVPADSPYAITQGAVDWSNMNRSPYHTYSSMGPTEDGRIKPDFSSPSRVSTATYGTTDFSGTSAAAPHFAGILALMKEKTPYSLSQIVTILTGRAIDLGATGKDNVYGSGFSNMAKK